jgi:hypothetical protein
MRSRILFASVTLFWLVMNILLWRAEYGAGRDEGTPVPVQTVWQKILTAPDPSTLDVMLDGRKIGTVRWIPNAGGQTTTSPSGDGPEGQVRNVTGYNVDADGNIQHEDLAGRLFFNLGLRFGTNFDWRSVSARVSVETNTWEVSANDADRGVRFKTQIGAEKTESAFTFDELRDTQSLSRWLGLPWLSTLTGGLPGFGAPAQSSGPFSSQIPWEAKSGWLLARQTRIKVYTLRARLLDRYDLNLYFSRVGEILLVEVPGNVRLVSETLREKRHD